MNSPDTGNTRADDTLRAAIVEAALDCIVSIDHEGLIREFNPAAERIFGHRRSDVLGRPMADVIVPPALREAHREGFARYLATRELHVINRHIELTALRADGSEFPVELTIIHVPRPGPPTFTAFLRDITELVSSRERTLRLQKAIAALAQAVTPEDVARVAMEQIVMTLGATAGSLHQADADGTLELITAVGYPGDYEKTWGRLNPAAVLPHTEAMRRGLPFFIEGEAEWRAYFLGTGPLRALPGSTAWAAIPLVVDGRSQGTIGVSFTHVGPTPVFDEGARAVALSLAQQCGQALERARLYTAMQEANADLAATNEQLHETALELEAKTEELQATTEELQQQTAVAECARHAAEAARAAAEQAEVQFRTLADAIPTLAWTARADGYIDWYNARWYAYTGTTAEQMAGWGWQSVHDPDMLLLVLDRWRASIATGEPFEMTFPLRGADGQFRSFLTRVVPTRDAEGNVTRWFGTNTDVESETRLRREVERLLAESERVRKDAETARERTAGLQALTEALATSATVDELAGAIVAHTTIVLGAVGTVVARLSEDGGYLELLRASQMPDAIADTWRRFPISAAAPLADVARTGEPIFLESRAAWVARYPDLEPLLEASGHHANIVVPLVVAGRVIGTLGVAFDSPRSFDAEDRAAALNLSRQCAQAFERARLFEAEHAAREAAEAANRVKSEFLTVMSHELRTPLNAIGGYAELLELGIRGPVTNEQRQDLARIRKSQRHLLGLINGVLNYSRLEAGTVQYDVSDVAVDEVLATCEALVAPQARAKHLSLRYPGCDPTLVARTDGEKLQQIVLNLLTNAVKFTEPGGQIELACTVSGDRMRVIVSDTGRGIPTDQFTRVFEPFVQLDTHLTRTQGGAGLGLAISRDLARGLDGDLTVTSEPGVGSTFTLTLPLPDDRP